MTWLNRDLITGPYLALCLCEAEFHKEMRHLKVPPQQWGMWVSFGAGATTHRLNNPDGNLACVVCVRVDKQLSGVQVAALLVHEAVHVWQAYCDRIGESNPSIEFEAYGIQAIAQCLMTAYAEAVK